MFLSSSYLLNLSQNAQPVVNNVTTTPDEAHEPAGQLESKPESSIVAKDDASVVSPTIKVKRKLPLPSLLTAEQVSITKKVEGLNMGAEEGGIDGGTKIDTDNPSTDTKDQNTNEQVSVFLSRKNQNDNIK